MSRFALFCKSYTRMNTKNRSKTMSTTEKKPRAFWQKKSLKEMNRDEWESLCDGCGKCCLNKIDYEDIQKIYYTKVSCQLFDPKTCRCSDYPNRLKKVKDCLKITPDNLTAMKELPASCAYRLIANNKPLKSWHHLVCGDRNKVHTTNNSVKNKVINEKEINENDLEDYIIDWIKPTSN